MWQNCENWKFVSSSQLLPVLIRGHRYMFVAGINVKMFTAASTLFFKIQSVKKQKRTLS